MARPLPVLLAALAFAAALGTAPGGFADEAKPAAPAAADPKPALTGMAKAIFEDLRGKSAEARKKDLAQLDEQLKVMGPQMPREVTEMMTGVRGHLVGMGETLDAMETAKTAKDDAKAAALEGKLRDQAVACAAFVAEGQKKLAKLAPQGPQALGVGEAAPALDAKIVAGDAVSLKFADHPGKPVVVEFWATWCGPCRESIPHIDALWAKHKDQAVFVGITDENEAEVKKFVAAQKAMRYPVAVAKDAVSQAYKVNGIPHAFIVVDGKIAWEGHPMDGLDEALEMAIAEKADGGKKDEKAAEKPAGKASGADAGKK